MRALVVGRPSLANARLAAALRERGFAAAVLPPRELGRGTGDVVLSRLDVATTLDGVEGGLGALRRVEAAGRLVLNRASALLAAHDKLATAVALARSGAAHPRTAHVSEVRPLAFGPPYVVKPRFGSWGRDVVRCETDGDLRACLARLAGRRWFRRQGALVQELVRPTGSDLRLVVAGGEVVGAVRRVAPPGEWRTNVALGASRRPVEPSPPARAAALAAAAAIGLDLAGVDLVEDVQGRPVVLEVNGAVDFTPEYGLGGREPFLAAVDALTARAGFAPEPAEAALAGAG